jgi:glycosyltransferase involved in cell wall biosynthesis
MRLSVFTPSHNPRHLDDCYRSLAAQTLHDWEWVVLPNGKLTSWQPPEADERVRVERVNRRIKGVGAAKRAACELATGDVLVELDHDDLLTSTCLADVREAFERETSAVLVYSDWAYINPDGSPSHERFNLEHGWSYTAETLDGTDYLRRRAMAATPHNVGYSWYGPNHVRAFRRTSYDAVGGYDEELTILEDHDLLIRLFKQGAFHHVDKCLYLQRIQPSNGREDPLLDAQAEQATVDNYLNNIEEMALLWRERQGLRSISLTTSTSLDNPTIDPRFESVLIDPVEPGLSFGDGSVGVIKAIDVLQRVRDRGLFLNECHRVLPHAGLLLTDTPSTDGRGAFQDPSNVAFYNENSFIYLTQAALRRTVPSLTTRWQVSNLQSYFPSQTHEAMGIPYVKANLMAVKEGPRQGGPLLS